MMIGEREGEREAEIPYTSKMEGTILKCSSVVEIDKLFSSSINL